MRTTLAALAACVTVAAPPAALAEGRLPSRPIAMIHLKAVPFTQVKIQDSFWAPRQETNRRVSIPHSLQMLEEAGNIKNLELAAAHARKGYNGPVFMDSDLYKAIEGASYSLASHPDPKLDAQIDGIIAKIAAAQMPDGYLDTWYEVNAPDRRWTNLRDNHELYCAGHLFEAAVAHFQATGKLNFLNVARKLADHIDSVFGPGKRMGYPGHPEIELALVKLARATGEKRYFNLAQFFITNRGRKFFAEEHHTDLARYDGSYWQDNVPIREHKKIVGHAVRAAYLMSGVVDVAGETADEGLLRMVDRVWRNTTERNMYITGGIGPSASNEGFTTDYDLPNLSAYQETCASVAMAMWNQRLALLYGDARYADLVERALYNGILSGVSLDGSRFFYVNPLESRGDHHRQGWYGCACCPPNVTRTLAQLGGYAYATGPDSLWVNLYAQGSVDATVGRSKVAMDVATNYPWDGQVRFTFRRAPSSSMSLHLRLPGWSSGAAVTVNGVREHSPVERGYLVINRAWKAGDRVELNLPMPVERIESNPLVKSNQGLYALQRGPIVYCLEAADNTPSLQNLSIPLDSEWKPRHDPSLLGGVTVLEGSALPAEDTDWTRRLYAPARLGRPIAARAIPYYAWDNRAPGEMKVWFPAVPPPARVGGPEARAKVSMSFVSGNCQPSGINDGAEPQGSGEQPRQLCHWWPHKGSEEWVQYTWKTPQRVQGVRAYWFDDTGRGECRLPASAHLEQLTAGGWKPVGDAIPVSKDQWCEIRFPAIETSALRIVLQMKPNWAAGIHEWQVIPADEE